MDSKHEIDKLKMTYTITTRNDNTNRNIFNRVGKIVFQRSLLGPVEAEMTYQPTKITSSETSPDNFLTKEISEYS